MWNYIKSKYYTLTTSVHTWWNRPQVPKPIPTTLEETVKNIQRSQQNVTEHLSNLAKEIQIQAVAPFKETIANQEQVLTLYRKLLPIVGESTSLSQEDRVMKQLLINKLNNITVNVTREINTLLETPTLTEEDRERLQQLALLKISTNFSQEITVSRDPTQSADHGVDNDTQLPGVDVENSNSNLPPIHVDNTTVSIPVIDSEREVLLKNLHAAEQTLHDAAVREKQHLETITKLTTEATLAKRTITTLGELNAARHIEVQNYIAENYKLKQDLNKVTGDFENAAATLRRAQDAHVELRRAFDETRDMAKNAANSSAVENRNLTQQVKDLTLKSNAPQRVKQLEEELHQSELALKNKTTEFNESLNNSKIQVAKTKEMFNSRINNLEKENATIRAQYEKANTGYANNLKIVETRGKNITEKYNILQAQHGELQEKLLDLQSKINGTVQANELAILIEKNHVQETVLSELTQSTLKISKLLPQYTKHTKSYYEKTVTLFEYKAKALDYEMLYKQHKSNDNLRNQRLVEDYAVLLEKEIQAEFHSLTQCTKDINDVLNTFNKSAQVYNTNVIQMKEQITQATENLTRDIKPLPTMELAKLPEKYTSKFTHNRAAFQKLLDNPNLGKAVPVNNLAAKVSEELQLPNVPTNSVGEVGE